MIPSSIYNFSFLTVFSVPYNQLHGSLPPGFGSMFPHPQILQLYGNQFTGPLPLLISNSLELVSFDVGENNFNGKITNDFGSLQNLRKITISDNHFRNGEPDELAFLGSLANCSNLEKLRMQGNQFRGVLPDSVGNLSNHLFYLTHSENQIYGTIPSTIGNLVNLALLNMYNNQFTGKIPPSIGFLQKLQRLSLDNNKLSGKIPNSIGNLSLLTKLYLAGNRIEGTIPSSLGTCRNLLSLHLFQNNLSGTIPGELLRISTLSISLNLAQNRLFGSLPADVGSLKNLMELDISENGLSGEIPSSLGSYTSLENLSLQENFFQGSIPLASETLRGIANFDLSHNLSGKIPTFLEKFALQKLNLSFNDFEGEVPMKGVFTNASAVSIVGNYRLCGGISELQLPNCITQKSKHKMPLSHILPITVAFVLVRGTLVWFLFCESDWFGSFGFVYQGIVNQDGEFVAAVKVLNLQNRGAVKSFIAECETLRNIRHRNLVKIITSCSSVDCQENDFKALVYEFMPNGSLEGWLHSSPKTNNGQNEHRRLNLLERINIAIDVACALDYVHHQCHTPIIHCDLKPSNILLDHDMVAHVGYFGLARFCPELTILKQSSSIGIRGSIGYVPLGNKFSLTFLYFDICLF
ncbi:putative receptor-like protein kinase At3g47110 [Camellia sinensis]|uniref:putative receptor-like protein kinase At3g47110 n=1 Tax=Camellia sinensis TaxID=4442 RepID=UPI001036C4B4|nr:putative receptor-like protein kinase At3g47110 [Camellia sinensis]